MQKKTAIITARMTPEDKQKIEQRAANAGMTVTDCLTTCALGKKIVRVDGIRQDPRRAEGPGPESQSVDRSGTVGRTSKADISGKASPGSIRKRGDSYLLVVSMGYDHNGKHRTPRQKTVKPPEGLTSKQREKWLNEQAVFFEADACENRKLTKDDFVFRKHCSSDPMTPSSFTWRFKLILKKNDLPERLNVHSLRHSNASLLIANGTDVAAVASLLGHSQPSTTLDIYTHAFDKNKKAASETLQQSLEI